MQPVVRADEQVGGRWIGCNDREVGRTRDIACPTGIGNTDAVAFRPCRALRSRDARYEEHRAAVAGDTLHQPDTPTTQPEMHEIRVFGAPRVLADARKARADTRKLAERATNLIDHVRRLGAQPTATRGRVAPPERHLGVGVGKQRDVQQECREARLADGSAAHDARQQRLARSESEFATDQVHHSGTLRGGEHATRLGRVACERFLTKHVLALGEIPEMQRMTVLL